MVATDGNKFTIEVAYAHPRQVHVITLAVAIGTTIRQAVALSGILNICPEIDLNRNKVGIYGADGMHSADAPKDFPDPKIVDGAGGTAPASADNPDFVKALKAFAPALTETQFASQVYDCANIFALAADQAKSNNAMDWAQYVNGITKDGTECNNYADCKKLVDAGTDIHYVGAAGDLSFTDAGEPGKATIETWRYEKGGVLTSLGTQESSIN